MHRLSPVLQISITCNVAAHSKIYLNIAVVILVMLYDDVRRREVSEGGRDIFG